MTTLTGKYVKADGSAVSGRVLFTPVALLTNPTTDEIVVPQAVQVELDNQGAFTVDLIATDNDAYNPTEWVYSMTERFEGGRTFTFELATGSPVDLADIVPPASWQGADFSIVMNGSLSLTSSFDGGDDDGNAENFDSTSRLNLYSYQRAWVESYGETIRHYLMRKDAKAMEAWYFPSGGYDVNREPVGDMKPVVWAGAHWEANNHASNHKHWSVETPDSDGSIETRFEVRWGNPTVDDSIAGLDKTLIATNLADFVVRCSNGQVFRISSPSATSPKVIEFNHDYEGTTQYRRWQIRVTEEAESTGNAGTNFQIRRYDDAGTFVDSPIHISRADGRVRFGGPSGPSLYSNAGILQSGGPFKPAVYSTGSRPTASSAGVGAMVYDSTLGIPIWSNGTVWKDASGTTV